VIGVSSPEVAEMAKLLENTFRLVNISLINEISKLSAKMGLNTREVVDAANTKPFGFMKFLPSIGIGGHCIPIDPIYLTEFARSQGVEQTLIETAKNIDNTMTTWIVEQVKNLEPEIRSITVVGVGYKAGSRDTRHSPSIRLIRALRDSGYQVDWLDSIVEKFEDEVSNSNLASQLAILAAPDSKFDAERYLIQGGKIFDFTGSLNARKGIIQF
jgi:UDP-N-acetyl-D-glucosamine dehydrogenase